MLVIREEQMSALRQAAEDRDNADLAAYLRAIMPSHFERLREGEAILYAARCRQKALRHGADNWRDMARFASVTLFLGTDFDEDPGLPWAAAILHGTGIGAAERIDRLMTALDAWIDALPSPAATGDAV
jgi:hypothetical protein